MGFKSKAIILLLALAASASLSARENERKDSLVRLIKAAKLELIGEGQSNWRRVIEGTFMHNGAYFKGDTTIWKVEEKIINAWGHVQVIQDETILTSEKMDYIVDENLVKCRGGVVQLEDSRHNTLRTYFLDYNTRDSLAYFQNGAAMRDSDGQIIESNYGSYDARTKVFRFQDRVNMFTDSIFIKTTLLDYESVPGKANFLAPIDFWKEDNMLSAEGGWYLRPEETFFFEGSVHATSKEQEAWSDSLYYYRIPGDILLLGNAQVQDSTRDVAALANRIYYTDSLSQVDLSRDAAVALSTVQKVQERDSARVVIAGREQTDTLYFGADRIVYRTVPRNKVAPADSAAAVSRLSVINTDPVKEYRSRAAKAAEEAKAAEAAAQAEAETGIGATRPGRSKNAPLPGGSKTTPAAGVSEKGKAGATSDTTPAEGSDAADSEPQEQPDAPAAPADSALAAPAPPDTSRIGFLDAAGNVRAFRKDLQMRCDSLRYNDLDSIARLYINPFVWSEGDRQYSADSLLALVKNKTVDRVSLQGNAFIITREDSLLYDQIKATEVMAYFDSTAALSRFDALGGATALFFLKEKDKIATVNKVETKMISALFENGDIDRIFYFDAPKNDVYPLPQLKSPDRSLKGFNWQPDKRPKGASDITSLKLRPSERSAYEARPRTVFRQTEIYFPGYMAGVYKSLEEAKNRPGQTPEKAPLSLQTPDYQPDSLASEGALPDSLSASFPADSAAADSVAVQAADTLAAGAQLSPEQARRARRDSLSAARKAAKEARWAELDARDAAKKAAKEAKKQERLRKQAERILQRRAKQEEADRRKLEKYIEHYRKKKAREDARKPQINNTQNNGTDIETLPPLHGGGHSEQRGLPKPALDRKTVESTQTPLQRTE